MKLPKLKIRTLLAMTAVVAMLCFLASDHTHDIAFTAGPGPFCQAGNTVEVFIDDQLIESGIRVVACEEGPQKIVRIRVPAVTKFKLFWADPDAVSLMPSVIYNLINSPAILETDE